jgi:uncharacterized membrane protein
MTRLALGVLIWSVVHFIPALATDLRKNMVNRFGEYPYKGVFALLMAVSMYLIITGWKSMTPEAPDVLELVFTPPDWGGFAAAIMVLISFILFLAPYPPNNIKRMMRHPQLTGVVFWCAGHLLAVGTARSVVLFGGLAIWAVLEMFLINRRDGDWVKPGKVSQRSDIAMLVFSILAYMIFLYTHELIFGGAKLI